ncbi:MAG: hypothetical protein QUS11_02295 [Candidatus Fermentibacter sp.]|nr:hypothetical protein [Candidatus Fermentibacter sp.]
MKKLSAALAACLAAISGCGSSTGPSGPGAGAGVAWFDGIACTVDIYYPQDGTLSPGAFVTGVAPNDIVLLEDGTIAVVNSISYSVSFFDPAEPGQLVAETILPAGVNPYCACVDGSRLYVSCLLGESSGGPGVCVIDLSTHEVIDEFYGVPNASGIAAASGRLFVSTQNWPDASVQGTFVLDPETGEVLDTLATPPNTTTLRYFPATGMIHASSTTYTDDGAITIIDPSAPAIAGTIATGGTPGLPCRIGDRFVAGDSWSSSRVYLYDEAGTMETFDAGFGITGIAATGDTLFMTAFDSDIMLVMDGSTMAPVDTLQAGDGPQGILIIPE